MKINIQSVHFDADKKLIEFIEGKLENWATLNTIKLLKQRLHSNR
jgi:hypothetical protein